FGLRRGPELRFAISVPHGSSIDSATVSADVAGRGRFRTAKVHTTSGDVSLGAVAGDATVKTVSGDLDVERVDGKASLNSVSGDLELGPVAGEISASTVSGDLHVTSAGSSVNAKGVSGDVTVESVRRGEARLQSVSGDITLGVAAGARVWMDVSSMSGSTQSDLEPDEAGAGGEVDLRIKANSASGDIRLQRTAPARPGQADLAAVQVAGEHQRAGPGRQIVDHVREVREQDPQPTRSGEQPLGARQSPDPWLRLQAGHFDRHPAVLHHHAAVAQELHGGISPAVRHHPSRERVARRAGVVV